MKHNINKILNDLYQLDSSFKSHEKELKEILNDFIEAKKSFEIDENFAKSLRGQIINRTQNSKLRSKLSFFNFTNMYPKLSYVFSGALITALMFFGAFELVQRDQSSPNSLKLAFKNEIIETTAHAFGPLNVASSNQELTRSAVKGFGGGGGGAGFDQAASSMIAPEFYYSYKYVYTDEELNINDDQLPIFKRVTGGTQNNALTDILSQADFGLFDITKFSNFNIENLTLIEDKDYGYGVSLNFVDESYGIYQNWQKWPNFYAECKDDIVCIESKRPKASDIPADEELIKIADEFLKQYNINTSNYGTPVINKYWEKSMSRESEIYIPEAIEVVYPLIINGQVVHDEGGNKVGLNVIVNIMYKKVSGVWNLRQERYESSLYEVEKNPAEILKVAEKGGFGTYEFPGAEKQIEVKLGTPTLSLVRIWRQAEQPDRMNEILVPSYIFPIVEKPSEGYMYRDYIVVPLVKELIESDLNNIPTMPRPMPLPVEGDDPSAQKEDEVKIESTSSGVVEPAVTEPRPMPLPMPVEEGEVVMQKEEEASVKTDEVVNR